jgi:hypothetical protein
MSRGMVKWNAFNALIDQGERLSAMSHARKKQPMPLLSQEEKNDMDRVLQIALNDNIEVQVTYYEDGFFHQTQGMITKVDSIDKVIVIAKTRYSIPTITRLELIQS